MLYVVRDFDHRRNSHSNTDVSDTPEKALKLLLARVKMRNGAEWPRFLKYWSVWAMDIFEEHFSCVYSWSQGAPDFDDSLDWGGHGR